MEIKLADPCGFKKDIIVAMNLIELADALLGMDDIEAVRTGFQPVLACMTDLLMLVCVDAVGERFEGPLQALGEEVLEAARRKRDRLYDAAFKDDGE